MSTRSKKRRSSKRISRSTPKSKAQSIQENQSYQLSMGQIVKVIDSWHAHVLPGMLGSIEMVYSDGYAVHFSETQGHLGKKSAATVFMPRGHVAAIAETDDGKPCLVNEIVDGAIRKEPSV